MTDRVALYLQDAHEIPEGIEYVKYAEEKGFEELIYVTDRRQQDHFQLLFLTAKKWFEAKSYALPELHLWRLFEDLYLAFPYMRLHLRQLQLWIPNIYFLYGLVRVL